MKASQLSYSVLSALFLGGSSVGAIDVDFTSTQSIISACSEIAYGMMHYYTGNNTGDTPGNLPSPYYWWEAGGMFGTMVDYWYYTGDESYIPVTTQGLLSQVGPDNDYMPPNQTKTEGNDDQAFWGFAVMSAAELKYPNPPAGQPQWLALAQAVFNTQAARWDPQTCSGGLRWQIFTFNNGYNYKNSISNGCFFQLAARLAAYTGNQTYAQWAEKTWDWVNDVGLMTPQYVVWDGTDDTQNCTSFNHIQWTYNAAVYLLGAATMWNLTSDPVWQNRTMGIINGLDVFFTGNPPVLYEVACEPQGTCDTDQRSFKAYVSRWMAATIKVAPFTQETLWPKLESSSEAAAAQCSGPDNACGLQWTKGSTYDGITGVGEQMSALQVIAARLINNVAGPVTERTGGTSKGDPAAGSGQPNNPSNPLATNPVTTGDKAGAGFLTAIILIGILGGAWWMVA
ncbi:MAG: hydrolase 76 protein [Bathelium mastoideum]|nr:MAG: hydrolase 76 protein [Bathelium mastoideum]KAI9688165.1 MAG: hydrolase 76 protein [Bathelium mastoideum]